MDMAKGIAALKSEAEINQAVIDIQRVLLDAQNAALADKQTMSRLSDEIAALKRQLEALGEWEAEKQRYVLTRSDKGAFTYDLKPEFSAVEPFHRLCTTCFGNGKKSLLHTTKAIRGGEIVKCYGCDAEFKLADFGDVAINYKPSINRW